MFNITSVLDYFIKAHADYKDIRQSSYQMFERGHVQVCMFRDCVVFLSPEKKIASHENKLDEHKSSLSLAQYVVNIFLYISRPTFGEEYKSVLW